MDSHDLKHKSVTGKPTENTQKRADFEAITHFGIVYMFFGSGSTEKEQNDTS
jgi:hypothetical protein